MTTEHPVDARRRALLVGAAALPWAGCARTDAPGYDGAWMGAAHERGHQLREAPESQGSRESRELRASRASHAASAASTATAGAAAATPGAPSAASVQRRAGVIVVGAGVSGLATARALLRAGIDDVHVFDLEDAAGGNSRGHTMGGMACPLGAHYLPVPGAQALEVAELLADLGLSKTHQGKTVFDERTLCHSPQERLFIDGQWVEGLLPPIEALPIAQQADARQQYLRFHAAIEDARDDQAFCVPTARAKASPAAAARIATLDAVSFSTWLDTQGYTAPALRWYLDYCCRDDYGAGAGFVSAWAGVHYFASRHGFHAPGADAPEPAERDAVLTWPEGNAWLTQRLAAPLRERLHTGHMALRVREGRHHASVDFWNARTQQLETWRARHVVLAVPLFIAVRLLENPPPALTHAAALIPYAPWLVANLRLREPLADAGGAAPAWDNVLMGSASLGYVDAMHQSTRPHPGPTVLTAYWALGGASVQELRTQRARLLEAPWSLWAGSVVRELEPAHPDLGARVQRIDLMRYGHAMAIPVPGVQSNKALLALAQMRGRVRFAHSDLAGYSVFEEALFHGERAGRAIVQDLTSPSRR